MKNCVNCFNSFIKNTLLLLLSNLFIGLEQEWANYDLAAICGQLIYLMWPAKLK